MTPLGIEILLHYHCKGNDYRDGDHSAPAVAEMIADFVKRGLLEPQADGERMLAATDATKVYVEALCAVQLPVQKWVMPDV